jgi:hypothetical protein
VEENEFFQLLSAEGNERTKSAHAWVEDTLKRVATLDPDPKQFPSRQA